MEMKKKNRIMYYKFVTFIFNSIGLPSYVKARQIALEQYGLTSKSPSPPRPAPHPARKAPPQPQPHPPQPRPSPPPPPVTFDDLSSTHSQEVSLFIEDFMISTSALEF